MNLLPQCIIPSPLRQQLRSRRQQRRQFQRVLRIPHRPIRNLFAPDHCRRTVAPPRRKLLNRRPWRPITRASREIRRAVPGDHPPPNPARSFPALDSPNGDVGINSPRRPFPNRSMLNTLRGKILRNSLPALGNPLLRYLFLDFAFISHGSAHVASLKVNQSDIRPVASHRQVRIQRKKRDEYIRRALANIISGEYGTTDIPNP
jgi:hypothetical protein